MHISLSLLCAMDTVWTRNTNDIGITGIKLINNNILVTSGYDNRIKFWDFNGNLLDSLQFNNQILSMNVKDSNLIIGLDNQDISLFTFSGNKCYPTINIKPTKNITRIYLIKMCKNY